MKVQWFEIGLSLALSTFPDEVVVVGELTLFFFFCCTPSAGAPTDRTGILIRAFTRTCRCRCTGKDDILSGIDTARRLELGCVGGVWGGDVRQPYTVEPGKPRTLT